MKVIGTVLWWSVSNDAAATDAELRALVEQHLPGIAPPSAVLPVDAFRRLTGPEGAQDEYVVVGQLNKPVQTATLGLLPAKAQKTMLVRALVRTVREEGVNKSVDKVGDVVFYKPSPGHKARLRITLQADKLPDKDQIAAFAAELRTEYDRALTQRDPQTVRRLIRSFLASVHALPLGAMYFVPEEDAVERLKALLNAVDGTTTTIAIPAVDVPEVRRMLREALAQAAERGELTDAMRDIYHPLIQEEGS